MTNDMENQEIDKQFWEIYRMISKGDVIKLRNILDSGVDPNLQSARGCILLMVAATKGNSAIVELLLSSGADPNLIDCWGGTAVSNSTCCGHYIALRLLLKAGGKKDACRYNIYEQMKRWNRLDEQQLSKITELLDQN